MNIPNKHPQVWYMRYRWRIGLFIAFALTIGWWLHLLDSGYCLSQMRYLSDHELIESALRREASYEKMMIDGSDESISYFLQKYPRCCGVNRHPLDRTVFSVMTGFNISEVELNYERKGTPDEIKKYGKFYKKYISVDACGPVLKETGGMNTTILENAF